MLHLPRPLRRGASSSTLPSRRLKEPINATSASLALMTTALWGGIVVAVKFSEDTLPPIAVAAVRFALAALFLLVWCKLRQLPLWPNPRELRLSAAVAAMLWIQILTFNYAVHLSNTSHGALLISSYVGWVALIEHFITRVDRLTWRKIQGIALAASGVAITLLGMGHETEAESVPLDAPSFAGDSLMLLSAVILGVKIVFTKHAVSEVEPNKLIFWHHVIGTSLFALCSLGVEGVSSLDPQVFTRAVVLALLYQGLVVGGICFAVQASLLRRHTATSLAVFGFATPVFGIVAAIMVRGDAYSAWLLLAAACVAIGIYLVNSGPST